jgi:hypothetical protein
VTVVSYLLLVGDLEKEIVRGSSRRHREDKSVDLSCCDSVAPPLECSMCFAFSTASDTDSSSVGAVLHLLLEGPELVEQR